MSPQLKYENACYEVWEDWDCGTWLNWIDPQALGRDLDEEENHFLDARQIAIDGLLDHIDMCQAQLRSLIEATTYGDYETLMYETLTAINETIPVSFALAARSVSGPFLFS